MRNASLEPVYCDPKLGPIYDDEFFALYLD